MDKKTRVPVILDTDIGDDIDDTWALGMALKCPEINLKLVTTDLGDTVYRAQLVAKMLETAGRTDVEVGVGIRKASGGGRQADWVKGYDLGKYPGRVHEDGVAALIDAIMTSKEQVTLIAIGPMPNVAAALQREPRIARKARFVGMHGSIRWGFGENGRPGSEYNVQTDVPACRTVFAAPWHKTITPLDTCGKVMLKGDRYRTVTESDDPVARAVIENYRIWLRHKKEVVPGKEDASSILFDTVAIHLAFSREFVKMESMGIRVTDDGRTVEDSSAPSLDVAIEWLDYEGYLTQLAKRMIAPATR